MRHMGLKTSGKLLAPDDVKMIRKIPPSQPYFTCVATVI